MGDEWWVTGDYHGEWPSSPGDYHYHMGIILWCPSSGDDYYLSHGDRLVMAIIWWWWWLVVSPDDNDRYHGWWFPLRDENSPLVAHAGWWESLLSINRGWSLAADDEYHGWWISTTSWWSLNDDEYYGWWESPSGERPLLGGSRGSGLASDGCSDRWVSRSPIH